MRTLDSIAALGPMWCAEWRDREGYLVEARLLDDIQRMQLLAQFNPIAEGGESATSITIVPVTEAAEEKED